MYDMDSLRHQLETVWANFILGEESSRKERANKYKTKKIMLRAHGVEAYYCIEFDPEHLALSHWDTPLSDFRPLQLILEYPELIGLLGGAAELMGLVSVMRETESAPEAVMEEEMFFAQHFTDSMSDAISGIRYKSQRE